MLKKPLNFLFAIFLFSILLVGCSGNGSLKSSGTQKSVSKDQSTSDASPVSLPKQMTWSVYDVGSGGYAEMSAIANSLTSKYGTQIRMLPSASGVGRMIPLKNNQASIGKLGDEIQFSFEAIEEFSKPEWGPQDVRAVWAPISQFGF